MINQALQQTKRTSRPTRTTKQKLSLPAIIVTISLIAIISLAALSGIIGTSNDPCVSCHSSNNASEHVNLLPSDAASSLPTTFQVGNSQDVKISVEVTGSGSWLSSSPTYFEVQTVKVTLSSGDSKVNIQNPQQQVTNKNPGNKFTFTWSVSGAEGGSETLYFDLWAHDNHNNQPSRAATFIDSYQYDINIQSAPDSPENLLGTPGDGFVVLSWDAPIFDGGVSINKYNIYKGTTTGGESFKDSVIPSKLEYNDTSVTNAQKYYYYVTAENSLGESSPSVEISVTPKSSKTVPEPPQNISATPGKNHIELQWREPSNSGGSPITEYLVFRDTTNGGGIQYKSISSDKYKYKDASVVSGTKYYYYLKAVNSIGSSAASIEVFATPDSEPPDINIKSPPNNTYINSRSISIEWQGSDAISGIHHYEVRLNNEPWLDVGTSLYHIFSSILDGQNKLYVKAVDSVGNSKQVYISVVLDLEAPAIEIVSPVNGSSLNSSEVLIKWNCSDDLSGLDYFEIKLDEDNWINVAQDCEYMFKSVNDGYHVVQVKAVDVTKNVMITQTSFTIDATSPEVISYSPFGTNVELDSDIVFAFSEQMVISSVEIVIENMTGTKDWNDIRTELIIKKDFDFKYETIYKITVSGEDLVGNKLDTFSWSFTTEELPKITGRVVDPNSNPVVNVNITIGSKTVKTNNNGYFTLKIQPGEYLLKIDKLGYRSVQQNVSATDGQTTNLGVIQLTPEKLPDNSANDTNNKDSSMEFPWVIIIIIVVVILVLIIMSYIINKKRFEK